LTGKDKQEQLPHLWEPSPDPENGSPRGWEDAGAPENDRVDDTTGEGLCPSAATAQENISRRENISENTQRKIFNGPPCPRCARPMEIRQHDKIHQKQRPQTFYYSRWYRCTHADCPTTLVMPPEFRVFAAADEQLRLQV